MAGNHYKRDIRWITVYVAFAAKCDLPVVLGKVLNADEKDIQPKMIRLQNKWLRGFASSGYDECLPHECASGTIYNTDLKTIILPATGVARL